MTLQQKIDAQISFAKQRMRQADYVGMTTEKNNWDGYIQGLRFVMTIVGSGDCQCSPTDLQPFGKCICGAEDVVAPI
jgi:hypothetical protein